MIIDNLKDKNIDWLIFDKAFMRSPEKSSIPRVWLYLKLLINILFSFVRKKSSVSQVGGLFYIDNTRHVNQAKLLIPNVKNALYHNNTNQKIKGGKQINISNGIYANYKKLLIYFPYFINEEINGNSIVFKNQLPLVINGILLYEHYIEFFKNNNIKFILIFTDHSYKNRALLFAAKHSGIPTIYIPHASVSEIFPPLEMDVAFLEGEDMKIKYENISEKWNLEIKTKIILSGNYKTNFYRNSTNCFVKSNQLSIGLSYNTLDSKKKVEDLVDSFISDSFWCDYTIIIRPHPSIKESLKFNHTRVKMSNPQIEDPMDFLRRINLLISGDSNIILEAALLKKYVFIINLSTSSFKDLYGFKKNNVCPFINEITELKPYLVDSFQNYTFNNQILSFYDNSFDNDFDGVKYITNYLNKVINQN